MFSLGVGDGRGGIAEPSSVTYLVIDNMTDDILGEYSSEHQAQHHLEQLMGVVGVAHFACPTCKAESGEWCFRWRTDRNGERYKEVMGGALLTCPDRLRLTEQHNKEIQELNEQGEQQ
jgi:hypothetical protein